MDQTNKCGSEEKGPSQTPRSRSLAGAGLSQSLKLFKPAKKDKISTIIIRQIRSAILQGKLKPGQSLPHEKELIAQFGVSKHTLREALRTLEGMGLITIKRGAGGGPIVSEIDFDTARDYFASFLYFQNVSRADIFELRKLAEPYIARRAAENITPEDLTRLYEIHEECLQWVRQGKNLVGSEVEILFHVFLAKLTNNPLLWVITDFVNNLLAEIKVGLKPGPELAIQRYEAHQKILDAIAARNPDAAEAAMRAHLDQTIDGLDRLPSKAE